MSSKLKLNMLKLVITTSPGGGWWVVGGGWVVGAGFYEINANLNSS